MRSWYQAFVTANEHDGTLHCELSKKLVANGHRFTVVTRDVGYLSGRQLVNKSRFVKRSEEEGVSILRTRTLASLQRGYVRRVLAFIAFTANAVIVGAREPIPLQCGNNTAHLSSHIGAAPVRHPSQAIAARSPRSVAEVYD
jgi:hypothetical protein